MAIHPTSSTTALPYLFLTCRAAESLSPQMIDSIRQSVRDIFATMPLTSWSDIASLADRLRRSDTAISPELRDLRTQLIALPPKFHGDAFSALRSEATERGAFLQYLRENKDILDLIRERYKTSFAEITKTKRGTLEALIGHLRELRAHYAARTAGAALSEERCAGTELLRRGLNLLLIDQLVGKVRDKDHGLYLLFRSSSFFEKVRLVLELGLSSITDFTTVSFREFCHWVAAVSQKALPSYEEARPFFKDILCLEEIADKEHVLSHIPEMEALHLAGIDIVSLAYSDEALERALFDDPSMALRLLKEHGSIEKIVHAYEDIVGILHEVKMASILDPLLVPAERAENTAIYFLDHREELEALQFSITYELFDITPDLADGHRLATWIKETVFAYFLTLPTTSGAIPRACLDAAPTASIRRYLFLHSEAFEKLADHIPLMQLLRAPHGTLLRQIFERPELFVEELYHYGRTRAEILRHMREVELFFGIPRKRLAGREMAFNALDVIAKMRAAGLSLDMLNVRRLFLQYVEGAFDVIAFVIRHKMASWSGLAAMNSDDLVFVVRHFSQLQPLLCAGVTLSEILRRPKEGELDILDAQSIVKDDMKKTVSALTTVCFTGKVSWSDLRRLGEESLRMVIEYPTEVSALLRVGMELSTIVSQAMVAPGPIMILQRYFSKEAKFIPVICRLLQSKKVSWNDLKYLPSERLKIVIERPEEILEKMSPTQGFYTALAEMVIRIRAETKRP